MVEEPTSKQALAGQTEAAQTEAAQTEAAGRLIGIARRLARRAPMETVAHGLISPEAGLDGDHKGAKFPFRQITVLAIEDWREALRGLGREGDAAAALPWTERRANLLVEGVRLPRAKGAVIAVGPSVQLEVTAQTYPCKRMDEAAPGLRKALSPHWRGGVTAKVRVGGPVAVGDGVVIVFAPPEMQRRLP